MHRRLGGEYVLLGKSARGEMISLKGGGKGGRKLPITITYSQRDVIGLKEGGEFLWPSRIVKNLEKKKKKKKKIGQGTFKTFGVGRDPDLGERSTILAPKRSGGVHCENKEKC